MMAGVGEAMATRNRESNSLEQFVAGKRALLEAGREAISRLASYAPASKTAAAHRDSEDAVGSIEKLNEIADTLMTLKSDELIAKQQSGGRQLCERCRHVLTSDAAQLECHIQERADQMMQLSSYWPREAFVRRMREELALGDEIVFLGVGRASILRGDGSTEVIYREKK